MAHDPNLIPAAQRVARVYAGASAEVVYGPGGDAACMTDVRSLLAWTIAQYRAHFPAEAPVPFTVCAISSNGNSFGLRSVWLVADNGQVILAMSNTLNLPKVGQVLNLTPGLELTTLVATYRFECPEFKEPAPPEILKKMLTDARAAAKKAETPS